MTKGRLDTSHLSKKTLYAAARQNEAAYEREKTRAELLAAVTKLAVERIARAESRTEDEITRELVAEVINPTPETPEPCECGGDCNEEEVKVAHV